MAVKPIPDGYHTITPFVMVTDALKLMDFLVAAFDATVRDKHLTGDKLMHGEVKVGDSILMLAEASDKYPAMPGMFYLYVTDVDKTYQQAVKAGGQSLRQPTTEFYGDRSAGVADAFGNQWWIATHVEDVSPEEMKRRQEEFAKQAQQQ